MAKTIFVLTVVAVVAASFFMYSTFSPIDEVTEHYEKFIAKFGRNYNSVEEYEFRKAIFEYHWNYVQEFNAQGKTWTLGINNFADKTKEEIRAFMSLDKKIDLPKQALGTIEAPEDSSVNDVEIDWRKDGFVLPVKNQGACGSCWAFAANVGVEAAWKIFQLIKTGKEVDVPDLSEQILVDCDPLSGGCLGGFMNNAYYWYTKNCPVAQKDYEYTARDEDCKASGKPCALDKLLGWYDIKEFDDEALRHALNLGPVPVAIQAENESFYLYETGIINGTECGNQLDHGVGLVGEHFEQVSTKSGTEEWKVWDIRNSWGAKWGEDGYVRIRREEILVQGYNVGVCGINMANSIPTFIDYYH